MFAKSPTAQGEFQPHQASSTMLRWPLLMQNEQSGGWPCLYNGSILEVASPHSCILCYEKPHKQCDISRDQAIVMAQWCCVVVLCCVLSSVCVFYFHSNMYIHLDDLSEVLHKYFLYRCRNCVLFSLKVGVCVCRCVCVCGCECMHVCVGVSVCISIHLNIAHNSKCVYMWHVCVCMYVNHNHVYTSSLVPGGMAVECIHQWQLAALCWAPEVQSTPLPHQNRADQSSTRCKVCAMATWVALVPSPPLPP